MPSDLSTAERAYLHVREKLLSGSYEPGTRLVTRAIAAEIGSSLNPVREALSRLASEGFVKHVPGSGTVAHAPTLQEIRDLYGVREALESYAASIAADRMSDDDIEQLSVIAKGWLDFATRLEARDEDRVLASERKEWISINERFARKLVQSAQNAQLTKTVEDQRLLSQIFQFHFSESLEITSTVARRIYDDHRVLVEALRKRDAAAAREQAAHLMRVGREFVLAQIETADDSFQAGEAAAAATQVGASDVSGDAPPDTP